MQKKNQAGSIEYTRTTSQKTDIQDDRIFYVYVHIRESDGKIFYVGKGKGSRDRSRSGRSAHWRNIVAKHGLRVQRIFTGISESEAYEAEIEVIKQMREKGERICNIANGGNGGLSGTNLSAEHIEKLRSAKTGKPQTPEHAEKSRLARKGKKNSPDHTERTAAAKRKPVINSDGEVFKSATDAARKMAERLGVSASQGNISMAARGHRNEAYGHSWSYDVSVAPKPPTGVTSSMKKIVCSNGMEFKSTQDAMRWVKTWRGKSNGQGITACARGEQATAYGFSWEYF